MIVLVAASIVFVVRAARGPSEPFISISFARTNVFGTNAISIELSNRMSFNLSYWIEADVSIPEMNRSRLANYSSNLLPPHSQRNEMLLEPSDGMRLHVSYERRLKPAELLVLRPFPWLSRHWPRRHHRRSPATYEWRKSETDVQVSSESKMLLNLTLQRPNRNQAIKTEAR
jgi:hypothetical protein